MRLPHINLEPQFGWDPPFFSLKPRSSSSMVISFPSVSFRDGAPQWISKPPRHRFSQSSRIHSPHHFFSFETPCNVFLPNQFEARDGRAQGLMWLLQPTTPLFLPE